MKRVIALCIACSWFALIAVADGPTRDGSDVEVELLIKGLSRTETHVGVTRCPSQERLIGYSSLAVPILRREARNPLSPVQRNVIVVLGARKEQAALPEIQTALKSEDRTVRIAAIWALGELKDAQSHDAVLKAMRCPDRATRFYAAQALIQMGDKTNSVPEFIRLLGDERWTESDGQISGSVVITGKVTVAAVYCFRIVAILSALDAKQKYRGTSAHIWSQWWERNQNRILTNEVPEEARSQYLPWSDLD